MFCLFQTKLKKIKHFKQFIPSSGHISSFQPTVEQSCTENAADEQVLNELIQLNSNFMNILQRVSNIEQLLNKPVSSPHHNGDTPSVADETTLIGFSGYCKHSNVHSKHRRTSWQQKNPLDPRRIKGFTIIITH